MRSRPQLLAAAEHFELQRVRTEPLQDGQALVAIEMVALSAWQGMRTKDFKNFIRPFAIGELISCDSFARIIESRCDALPVGAAVVGRQGWQDYAVITPADVALVCANFSAAQWLSALSSPGQTPYLAFSQKARPMPGETLVVTSAAGAVGSYAVQLGLLGGMRVVGIAGGAQKTAFVRDTLNADAALDYRAHDFEQALNEACPAGIHIYFDTVGGPIADCVSDLLAKRAQILLVGRVVANNSAAPEQDMANMRHIWSQEATVHAFNRYAYKELYPDVIDRLGELLRAGKLTMHNTVLDGMESTPTALNQLLSGQHIGKVLIRYADADGKRI
ncbi:MAG: NADPH-dependent curcumin reductase CurA [Gammaproteobacteria bacterium]